MQPQEPSALRATNRRPSGESHEPSPPQEVPPKTRPTMDESAVMFYRNKGKSTKPTGGGPMHMVTGEVEETEGDVISAGRSKRKRYLMIAGVAVIAVAATVLVAFSGSMGSGFDPEPIIADFRTYPCNPAVHCHESAVECAECDPMSEFCELDTMGEEVRYQNPGVCTKIERPKFRHGRPDYTRHVPLSLSEKERRCQKQMTRKRGRDTSQFLLYVSSCPQGRYTCFDGKCARHARTCFHRCKNEPHCRGSEVRYGKQRCKKDCRRKKATVEECVSNGEVSEITPSFSAEEINEAENCCGDLELAFNGNASDGCCQATQALIVVNDAQMFALDAPDNAPTTRVMNVVIPSSEDLGSVALHAAFTSSTNSCCCGMICVCAGDPHCSAFDGTRASSYRDEGTMLMYEEGLLRFFITQGLRGIIEAVTVFIPGDDSPYTLAAEDAETNGWKRIDQNGDIVTPDQPDLPLFLTLNFVPGSKQIKLMTNNGIDITLDVRKHHRAVIGHNDDKHHHHDHEHEHGHHEHEHEDKHNEHEHDEHKNKHHDEHHGHRQLHSKKEKSIEVMRFDVTINRNVESKRSDDGCCPQPGDLLSDFVDGVGSGSLGGFCFDPKDSEIAKHFEEDGKIFRRLREAPEEMVTARQLEASDSACDQLALTARILGIPLKSDFEHWCQLEQGDFGQDEIYRWINELMMKPCFEGEDFNNGIFLQELSECSDGVELEAKLRGSDDAFQFVRSFPSFVKYCDDEIRIQKNTGFSFLYNGSPTLLMLDGFDIRLTERTDKSPNCNACDPKSLLAKFQYTLRYDCPGTCQPTISGDTGTPTVSPTGANDTLAPSSSPTLNPTQSPSGVNDTSAPSNSPTGAPSSSPTQGTGEPSASPTLVPTVAPNDAGNVTLAPTDSPTLQPTNAPSQVNDTSAPTSSPSFEPTNAPTSSPSAGNVTLSPTDPPTLVANGTLSPTFAPSVTNGTSVPTFSPLEYETLNTDAPTSSPSLTPAFVEVAQLEQYTLLHPVDLRIRVNVLQAWSDFWFTADMSSLSSRSSVSDSLVSQLTARFPEAVETNVVFIEDESSDGRRRLVEVGDDETAYGVEIALRFPNKSLALLKVLDSCVRYQGLRVSSYNVDYDFFDVLYASLGSRVDVHIDQYDAIAEDKNDQKELERIVADMKAYYNIALTEQELAFAGTLTTIILIGLVAGVLLVYKFRQHDLAMKQQNGLGLDGQENEQEGAGEGLPQTRKTFKERVAAMSANARTTAVKGRDRAVVAARSAKGKVGKRITDWRKKRHGKEGVSPEMEDDEGEDTQRVIFGGELEKEDAVKQELPMRGQDEVELPPPLQQTKTRAVELHPPATSGEASEEFSEDTQ